MRIWVIRKLLSIPMITVIVIAIPIAGELSAQAVDPGTTQKPLTPLVSPQTLPATPDNIEGGVSNVDIDGNNAFQIKAIGVVISTFETLPHTPNPPAVSAQGRLHFMNA